MQHSPSSAKGGAAMIAVIVGLWPLIAPAQHAARVPSWLRNASYQNQALPEPAKGKDHILQTLDLKETKVVDAVRLIAELSGLNVVATPEAGQKVATVYLQHVRAIDAIETVAMVSGLWYREDAQTGTIRIMTTEQYQNDLVVRRDDITKVFTLLHPNASSVASAIEDLYGERVILSMETINDDDLLTGGVGGGAFGGGFGAVVQPGFGSPFGAQATPFGQPSGYYGGSRFARPVTGSQFFGTGMGRYDRPPPREEDVVPREKLSPELISQLEKRAEATDPDDPTAVTLDALRGLTQREPPIYVTINRQHNLVIVRTSDAEAMKAIERLVLEIDRPTPEVLLEMKILEVTLDDQFHSIFDLQLTNGPLEGVPEALQSARNPFLLDPNTAAQKVLGIGNEPLIGGTLLYQFLNDKVRAQIQFFQQCNRLQTIATPLLLASNNRPAKIFVGEERVMTTGVSTDVVTPATGATTTAIEPVTEIRDIGVTLFILPKINADRTVTLVINQESSTLNPNSASIPVASDNGTVQSFPIDTVQTANMQGTVVAKDGLTVAVGGLIREHQAVLVKKVPVLGDLPLLRVLFTNEIQESVKKELVLLITPHVISTATEGELTTQMRIQELSDHPYRYRIGAGESAGTFASPQPAPPELIDASARRAK
jgi:general secretion pathway protein D